MTSKNEFITDEERAAMPPALLEAIESNNVAAAAWLTAWRNRDRDEAQAQAAEVREMVAPGGQPAPEQGSLMQWCGFPTDMTRVSPFFPMAQDEMKERPFLRDFLITAAGWGEIRYTGPKLSIFEEDALLALLALLEVVSAHRAEAQDGDGRKTYTYRGPALPLLNLMYGDRRPSAKDYKRLVGALKLLTVAGVELRVAARTKTGKRKEPRFTSISAMLSNAAWDEEKKELSVTINPFFYETYFSGSVSLMDVQKRMAISGSIAKGLYRFVQSHTSKEPLWTGHFLTLAQVLNMNTDQPGFRIRELLKKAINELVAQGILTRKSQIIRQDIVTLYRADGSLPPRKKLKS
jgi:hypothetical protein